MRRRQPASSIMRCWFDRELIELRQRLRRARRRDRALAKSAKDTRRLAERLAACAGALDSCASCARHTDPPHGRYDGGFCCGGSTRDLFCDDEVAALALAGVRPFQLRAAAERAGCIFRGPSGCVLPPRRRPVICLEHFCSEAQRELHQRGRLDEIERRTEALEQAFSRFKQARALQDARG
jgi:hypothetical protein